MAAVSGLRKEAGILGLLYAGVGSVVGSGWLFGPLHAARQAGPLSLGSWVVGAVAVLLLAFVYSELGAMIPRSGALVHISRVSHGALLGRIWSWILFFGYVAIGPVEVMAVLSYANNYLPGLVQPASGLLTPLGFVVSLVLLGLLVALNFLAIRWVLLINSTATWWKLLVPAATVLVLVAMSFHPENLRYAPGRLGDDAVGMFTAVSTGGVIFSYFGFRQAIDLAGETADPGRNIPIAVVGSVVIGFVLYTALQLAFLLAMDPAALSHGGWGGLRFAGATGPFAAMAVAVGAAWWGVVLYIDAIVSPAGTAFIYCTAASRITMATGEVGTGPRSFARINRRGVPWVAVLVTYVVGALFFFPFPSWQKMVSYISSVTVLSYSIGPIVLLHLRSSMPDAARPFRMRAPWTVSAAAFVISNWIVFWTGLATLDFLLGLLAVVFVAYLIHYYGFLSPAQREDLGWAHVWWLLPYFGGLWFCTSIGPGVVGGNGTLTLFEDMGVIAAFSLFILWLALATAVDGKAAHEAVTRMVEGPVEAAP